MHIKIATAIVLSLAFAPQPRGWVSSVTAAADAGVGTYRFTVRGNNPCGAVTLDFGDGTTAVTHAINQVPVTVPHEYAKVGNYRVRARGQGNCDGDVFTEVNVTRVRSRWPDRTENRYTEMDQNGDGVITRAEWRGTAQAFDVADWNNDGRLSGDEVRAGATRPNAPNQRMRFGEMDQNQDGVIARNEWRGNPQQFDQHDWNSDGRLSGEEVRPGARPQYQWTEVSFRRFDRNRDNYISGNEWRYEPDDFLQVDRNNDDRVSLAEFIDGDLALGGVDPGARGRGRGRGNDQAVTTVVVTNRQVWTDSGIDVRVGDTLDITATGRVQFSRQPNDVTGPNGVQVTRPRAPMPNMNVGALVARVANSAPFFVGARGNALRVPQAGRLYLAINDDILTDNNGEFRVTVDVNGRGRGRGDR